MPDDVLLAGFAAGDSHLAKTFVGRFQRAVFGVAYTVVGDQGVAEDVAQQAFERAWRHADTYDPRRGSVRSWLARIAHNLAVDAVRMRRADPIDPHDLQDYMQVILRTPEQDALDEEKSARLRAMLATIPEEQARAVIMASIHAMTAREIAQTEHIPIGTAKYRIRAGLIKLHTAVPGPQDD